MNLPEIRKAFSKALSRLILPEIVLPALLLECGFGILGFLLSANFVRKVLETRVPTKALADEAMLLSLFLLITSPFIASALYSVSRAVVIYRRGRWGDLWSGLTTYWWRLVGLGAMAYLAASVLGLIMGTRTVSLGAGRIADLQELFQLNVKSIIVTALYLVARYLVTPVVPIMVIEQAPAMKSIELGVRFAWRNPSIMVPIVAVDLALAWVLQRAGSATGSVYDFGLNLGSLLPHAMTIAVAAIVSAYFRLLYLGIYYDNLPPLVREPAEPEESGEPEGQETTEEPEKPRPPE